MLGTSIPNKVRLTTLCSCDLILGILEGIREFLTRTGHFQFLPLFCPQIGIVLALVFEAIQNRREEFSGKFCDFKSLSMSFFNLSFKIFLPTLTTPTVFLFPKCSKKEEKIVEKVLPDCK